MLCAMPPPAALLTFHADRFSSPLAGLAVWSAGSPCCGFGSTAALVFVLPFAGTQGASSVFGDCHKQTDAC